MRRPPQGQQPPFRSYLEGLFQALPKFVPEIVQRRIVDPECAEKSHSV